MAPSEGWFKLNVDGAAKLEGADGGAGRVLRGFMQRVGGGSKGFAP